VERLLVNIDVDDLPRAERFYVSALDLEVGRRFGEDGVELVGLEAPLYLLRAPAGSVPFADAAPGEVRRYGRHWTPVHLDVAVDDLEAALSRAEAAGARREGEVESRAWGRMAVLSDPFGHGLCLLELTLRGYDVIATG
jgi:predicted enzyme related to lactoylglutathione lyase